MIKERAAMPATPRNMREHGGPGVFVYSPNTGEQFSATAGDYFMMDDDAVLTDREGQPCVLAVEHTEIRPLTTDDSGSAELWLALILAAAVPTVLILVFVSKILGAMAGTIPS